jgi:hypothetical protein
MTIKRFRCDCETISHGYLVAANAFAVRFDYHTAMSAPQVSRRELWKEIWKLAWPIAGSNFLLRGAAIVDTAMVGRLGAAALAGLGIAQISVFLSMAIEQGLGVGGHLNAGLKSLVRSSLYRRWSQSRSRSFFGS